jgi:hypothetical protein
VDRNNRFIMTGAGQEPGLSGLRVHQLHLCGGSHPTSIATFGLHLVLNGANGIHPTEQVSWSHMSRVDKVCWLSNHTSVNTSSPFRLRLFRNAAIETQPEFTHAYSPRQKWAPMKVPNLNLENPTKVCRTLGMRTVHQTDSFTVLWLYSWKSNIFTETT